MKMFIVSSSKVMACNTCL